MEVRRPVRKSVKSSERQCSIRMVAEKESGQPGCFLSPQNLLVNWTCNEGVGDESREPLRLSA